MSCFRPNYNSPLCVFTLCNIGIEFRRIICDTAMLQEPPVKHDLACPSFCFPFSLIPIRETAVEESRGKCGAPEAKHISAAVVVEDGSDPRSYEPDSSLHTLELEYNAVSIAEKVLLAISLGELKSKR